MPGTSLNSPSSSSSPDVHRRSAGPLPGLARTASALRQPNQPVSSTGGSTTTTARPSPLLSLPAHLRPSTAPRIPSPLGKGTPHKYKEVKQSLPVRTSKITQKHVFLPEEPQTKPLPASIRGTPLRMPPPKRAGAATAGDDRAGDDKEKDERSEAEGMTKAQREEAGLPRLTAYATADSYRTKLLQAYLRREHGVGVVRVFDDAIYAVYNLPLLPGYGAGAKVRSSPAVKSPGGVSLLEKMTEAEEVGYHDGFFPVQQEDDPTPDHANPNEYMLSTSPQPGDGTMSGNEELSEEQNRERERERRSTATGGGAPGGLERRLSDVVEADEVEEGFSAVAADSSQAIAVPGADATPEDEARTVMLSTSAPDRIETEDIETESAPSNDATVLPELPAPLVQTVSAPTTAQRRRKKTSDAQVGEVVIFDYGVTVFFGFTEREEREILDDFESAGAWVKSFEEDDWEVEECHFVSHHANVAAARALTNVGPRLWQVHDPEADYPRIYNDMFSELPPRLDLNPIFPPPLTELPWRPTAFVSHSHLLKLSVSHAIAQSTKLSIYENSMQAFSASTASLPKELATTGALQLKRKDALTLTGRFFKLRMDINLSSGILGEKRGIAGEGRRETQVS